MDSYTTNTDFGGNELRSPGLWQRLTTHVARAFDCYTIYTRPFPKDNLIMDPTYSETILYSVFSEVDDRTWRVAKNIIYTDSDTGFQTKNGLPHSTAAFSCSSTECLRNNFELSFTSVQPYFSYWKPPRSSLPSSALPFTFSYATSSVNTIDSSLKTSQTNPIQPNSPTPQSSTSFSVFSPFNPICPLIVTNLSVKPKLDFRQDLLSSLFSSVSKMRSTISYPTLRHLPFSLTSPVGLSSNFSAATLRLRLESSLPAKLSSILLAGLFLIFCAGVTWLSLSQGREFITAGLSFISNQVKRVGKRCLNVSSCIRRKALVPVQRAVDRLNLCWACICRGRDLISAGFSFIQNYAKKLRRRGRNVCTSIREAFIEQCQVSLIWLWCAWSLLRTATLAVWQYLFDRIKTTGITLKDAYHGLCRSSGARDVVDEAGSSEASAPRSEESATAVRIENADSAMYERLWAQMSTMRDLQGRLRDALRKSNDERTAQMDALGALSEEMSKQAAEKKELQLSVEDLAEDNKELAAHGRELERQLQESSSEAERRVSELNEQNAFLKNRSAQHVAEAREIMVRQQEELKAQLDELIAQRDRQ